MKRKVVCSLILMFLTVSEFCAQVTATQCYQAVNVCSNAGFAISPNGSGTMPAAGTFGNPNVVTPPLGAPGGLGCLLVGALNSTWMIINIQTSGTLEFSFGAGSVNPQAGCYDWSMWPYGGGVNCAQITGGSVAPVRCNWNSPCNGGTGIANNLPPGSHATNFPPGLAVTCGQQFIICFSNYSSANTIVNLNFFGSAQVSCNPIPNPLLLANQTICQGNTAVLTVTGSAGNTYTWQPGSITGTATSISVSPTVTTTYSVLGAGGCGSLTGSTTAVVTVNSANGNFSITNANPALPGNSVNGTQCLAGNSFNFNSLSASGIHSWNFGAGASPLTSSAINPTAVTYSVPGTYTVSHTVTSGACVSTIIQTLEVHPDPQVSFTTINNCKNSNIVLNNTSTIAATSSITNYTWSFGAGANPASSNLVNPPTLFYNTSGIQTITLSAVSNKNCVSTTTGTVQVYTTPTSSFNVSPVCFGTTTTFTDLTTPTGSIATWAWDFDNNTTLDASTQNPTFNYPASGTYTAVLITASSFGCRDTLKKTVTVYGRSVPDFGPTTICFNTPTAFTNSTSVTVHANTGAIASYSWSFGAPGGTSSQTNPIYTYTSVSNATANTTYTAWLYATTVNGCKDSISKQVMVYSLPTVNYKADSVCLGLPTTFSFTGSTNGNPFSMSSWDFNNDGSADLNNTSVTASTVMPNIGNSMVGYTVYTNPSGVLQCSASITKAIWVHPIPVANITSTNTCVDIQPLNMSAVSSSIAIGTIANYAWSYGNGNSSLSNTNAVTSQSYSAAGNYVLTLTVTSNAGCKDITNKTIEIWERPNASFISSKTCFGKTTTLTANQAAVSASIASFDWDMNGTPSSIEAAGRSVNYLFNSPGTQTVNLVLTSDKGCKNRIQGRVYVNYLPKPDFYTPKRNGCADLCTAIIDSSAKLTGPAENVSWLWNFGNGQTLGAASGGSNTICYTNSSNTALKNYTVKLVVKTDSGCVDSIKKTNYITVYPNPLANYKWQGQDGNILFSGVEFTNTSVGASHFYWYYNDGVNKIDSVNANPTHFFDTDVPRNYQVWLAVRNLYGCKDTINQWIDIGPEFAFYMPNTFTPNGDGINDIYTGKGIGIKNYNLQIFDRWGERIFVSEDINTGWDGSVRGKMVDVKTDVYQWKVDIIDLRGKARSYVGNVSLIK